MRPADCVAIVSGGMDSVTMLHHLVKTHGYSPAVVTFQYGQKHSRETSCARLQAQLLGCQPHLVLDITSLGSFFQHSALIDQDRPIPTLDQVRGNPQPATYVPNRNMVFLSLAAAYAETNQWRDLYYGAQRHDLYGYWDTTPAFLDRLNALLALNRDRAIQVHAPFVSFSKSEIVQLGLGLGVDYAQTWSCYQGGTLACGVCPTCKERLDAFAQLGIEDPLSYAPLEPGRRNERQS